MQYCAANGTFYAYRVTGSLIDSGTIGTSSLFTYPTTPYGGGTSIEPYLNVTPTFSPLLGENAFVIRIGDLGYLNTGPSFDAANITINTSAVGDGAGIVACPCPGPHNTNVSIWLHNTYNTSIATQSNTLLDNGTGFIIPGGGYDNKGGLPGLSKKITVQNSLTTTCFLNVSNGLILKSGTTC